MAYDRPDWRSPEVTATSTVDLSWTTNFDGLRRVTTLVSGQPGTVIEVVRLWLVLDDVADAVEDWSTEIEVGGWDGSAFTSLAAVVLSSCEQWAVAEWAPGELRLPAGQALAARTTAINLQSRRKRGEWQAPNPSAGVDWSFGVQGNVDWYVDLVGATLTTSNAGGDRVPVLRLLSAGIPIAAFAPAGVVPPGSSVRCTWAVGAYPGTAPGVVTTPMPATYLTVDSALAVQTRGLQAGDQWSLVVARFDYLNLSGGLTMTIDAHTTYRLLPA